MIEKIGSEKYKTWSVPAVEVLSLIEKLKKSKRKIIVGEIGVGIGATSVEILKRLDKGDTFYLLSYEKDINELTSDLNKINSKKVNIIGLGNSTLIYDSYNWNLAKLALKIQSEKKDGMFDLIYLDGAHTFFHDATACCCIKLLLKAGGYVVFDDMYWTFAQSPTSNPEKQPEVLQMYTKEQLEAYQVDMVVSLFMRTDKNFKQILMSDEVTPWRTVWMRMK